MTKTFRHPRVSLTFLLALAAAVAAALLVAGPASASGNYTCPPSTGADVQVGINDGGTVYIHGTCHGNFYVDADNAPNVTLIGLGVNPTLNGDGTGPVLEVSGPVTVTVKNLTLTNGSNEVGGGIDAHYGCDETDTICGAPTVNVIGSKITGNTAAGGGGLYAEGCDTVVNVTNTTVGNNTATDGDGGGLQVEDCAFLSMTGSTVTKNTASEYGGGLSVFIADASINASTFSTNTAQDQDGGGIAAQFSDVQVTNSKLSSNWAYGYGGGIDFGDALGCQVGNAPAWSSHSRSASSEEICIGSPSTQGPRQPVELPPGLTVTNSTVDHNTAAHSSGGGISNFADLGDSPVTITGSTLSNNIAPGTEGAGGGGYEQDSCDADASATITSTKIYGNTALNGVGGGIENVAFCDGGAEVTLAGTTLQNPYSLQLGNQAKWGGGIYNAFPTASVGLQAHTTISRNKATVNGGGVYDDCGGSLTIDPLVTLLLNTPNNVFNSAGCLID